MAHICVSIVLYGECPHALAVMDALRQQELDEGTDISLVVVDNGVTETLRAEILEKFGGKILLLKNRENLGFSAAVNQCVAEALNYGADFLLLLNPDLKLHPRAIGELLQCASRNPEAAMFSPKLLKADSDLAPVVPATLDACGMLINKSLRHLDRGSGCSDVGQFETEEQVFGGTGACLMIRISQMQDLFLTRTSEETRLFKIYPQLESGADSRPQLLDEAFFAYREDADLAFRAAIKGKKIIYCPKALGWHVRRVVPENRLLLDPEINALGVRNRFLLQLNNYCPLLLRATILPGLFWRNLLVVAGVLIKERSSLRAFKEVILLFRRALLNRKQNLANLDRAQYSLLAKFLDS